MKANLPRNIKLTKKEEEIMQVLWDAQKPLTASDICDHARTMGMDLNQSTVQMTVNKLLKAGMIRVGEITQAHKVLARAFEPTLDPDELAVLKFKQATGKTSSSGLVAALLAHIDLTDSDIHELSSMLEEMKKK